jgi:hypothetical protein
MHHCIMLRVPTPKIVASSREGQECDAPGMDILEMPFINIEFFFWRLSHSEVFFNLIHRVLDFMHPQSG